MTGASGLIGSALVSALAARGAAITVLARDPDRAREVLGSRHRDAEVQAVSWDPRREPAPAHALAGRDAVVNLAGEPIGQRWTAAAKSAIHESRVAGTRNLVAGIEECEARPRTLLSASAVGYYGPRGEEPLDEDAPPGDGFLAEVCVAWEEQAARASALGVRVARIRTGVVLAPVAGALQRMLLPFRLGLGGPVAGGRQYMSWIHIDDHVAMLLAALADERFSGAVNATAPEPVSNGEFSKALARVLRRPAVLPVPALVLRAVFGEMSEVVTTGQRALPAKALMAGFEFHHPGLDGALRAVLGTR